MGCSATKTSRVTSVNNDDTAKNGGCRGPDQRVNGRVNQRNQINGNIYNESHRKKITPWPKKSAGCDKLPEGLAADSDDDEVFLPDERGRQTEVPDRDVTTTHQKGLNKESHKGVQNGDPTSKPEKTVPSPPLLYGHREVSNSQVEFFRILDEKIAMGQSLSSLGSVR